MEGDRSKKSDVGPNNKEIRVACEPHSSTNMCDSDFISFTQKGIHSKNNIKNWADLQKNVKDVKTEKIIAKLVKLKENTLYLSLLKLWAAVYKPISSRNPTHFHLCCFSFTKCKAESAKHDHQKMFSFSLTREK